MIETQQTISAWAVGVFGEGGSNASVAVRANVEMAELLTVLVEPDFDRQKAAEELADVVICLARLAERIEYDFSWARISLAVPVNRTWAFACSVASDVACLMAMPNANRLADAEFSIGVLSKALHVDLAAAVDAKMAVNRVRTWRVEAGGQGRHTEEGVAEND